VTGFDAAALHHDYEFIDKCPEALLDQVVTLPLGNLVERVAGVDAWRQSLLRGEIPSAEGWPTASVSAPVRTSLAELGIARFCKGEEALVDALMRDILDAFVRRVDSIQHSVEERLEELERLERERLTPKKRKKRTARAPTISADVQKLLERQARNDIAKREPSADSTVTEIWGDRARQWSSIAEIFGDLGQMLGRGWDLSRGVLRHIGWMDVVRIKALIENLPQLKAIIRSLGMLQVSQSEDLTSESIFSQICRLEEELVTRPTPHIPAEVRGIGRSGEISRMLPVEAAMLGHPKLRLLWHARRAERALLTYQVSGDEIERVSVERFEMEESKGRRPRPERGPIVAVVDTSGSMHGVPEQVAKALVLEAMRVAHNERRRCYLYAYSGPGEVVEHELDLSPEGIGRLLEFLLQTFGGGTDLDVMREVAKRLRHDEWRKADVLLVTDGEWRAPPAVVKAVSEARDIHGSRFHGVQIGNLGRTGLHDLCDPVHVFRDWISAGGWNR